MTESNVVVVCRFRPMNRIEEGLGAQNLKVVEVQDHTNVFVDANASLDEATRARAAVMKTVFSFDRAFEPGTSQEEVFEHTARSYSEDIMKGFNCTIFAYGQTGSGKTFTMMGTPGNEGIIPRLANSIFEQIEQADEQVEFTVKISYVEIYMERIKDLLDSNKTNLRIREGARGVWIQDVTERYVSSMDEILEIMRIGSEERSVASTNMNDESSRSHSVFLMTLGQRNKVSGSKTGAKLILVDLAGSETVAKTGASGNTLKEAQHINKSLSALGNVINALTSGSAHIPYRDSKLTRLLSDSLGGNSKTCLIVTASPSVYNLEETLSTLRFGNRAKKIRNKPTVNQEKSVAEYKALLEAAVNRCTEQEELIQRLQRQVAKLKEIIKNMGGTVPADLEVVAAAAVGSSGEKRATLTDDFDYDHKGDSNSRAEKSSAFLQHLVLEGELKDKEEAIKELQSELEDREAQVREFKDLIDAKTEEMHKLQSEVYEARTAQTAARGAAAANSEADLKFKAQGDLFEAAKKRIESLEKEQKIYLEQIDRLQADNMELAKFQQVHLAPPVVAHRVSSSSKKRASQSSSRSAVESDSDSDDQTGAGDQSPAAANLAQDDAIRALNNDYQVLMAALSRKCEQYIKLQMDMQKQNEKVLDLERKMQAQSANASGPSPAAAAAETTKLQVQLLEMQKRLEASEALCKKLFDSGLYWQKRGQRKDRELKDLRRQTGVYDSSSRSGGRASSGRGGGSAGLRTVNSPSAVSSNPDYDDYDQNGDADAPRGSAIIRITEPDDDSRSAAGPSGGLSRVGRSPSIAAKVVAPQIIHGGRKGSTRPVQADSKSNVAQADSMDQFF